MFVSNAIVIDTNHSRQYLRIIYFFQISFIHFHNPLLKNISYVNEWYNLIIVAVAVVVVLMLYIYLSMYVSDFTSEWIQRAELDQIKNRTKHNLLWICRFLQIKEQKWTKRIVGIVAGKPEHNNYHKYIYVHIFL